MPLADQWTLASHRTVCRRELADPSGNFWPDDELNLYINDWQALLQQDFEFVWGITTATQTTSGTDVVWDFGQWNGSTFDQIGTLTTLATITIDTLISNIMRPDAVYFIHADGTSVNRLSPRSKIDLDFIKRDWRDTPSQATPVVVYQDDTSVINLWPNPTVAGTLILEYPLNLTLTTDTSTMQIPAWTKYSCKDYVAYRAYTRFGAAQNLNKGLRYKQKFEDQHKRFTKFYDNYMPEKAVMLRPGRKWSSDILRPRRIFLEQH